jgi:aspartyl-tRNA(Asn)/glutamyl-tRNA(Gln) amidotransferase subunit C
MAISGHDVRHVAALARLEIADERIDTLVRELNGILVHMEVLQQVEMSSADPQSADATVPTPSASTALRPDEPRGQQLARARAEFAPAERDGFFLVPRLSTHE